MWNPLPALYWLEGSCQGSYASRKSGFPTIRHLWNAALFFTSRRRSRTHLCMREWRLWKIHLWLFVVAKPEMKKQNHKCSQNICVCLYLHAFKLTLQITSKHTAVSQKWEYFFAAVHHLWSADTTVNVWLQHLLFRLHCFESLVNRR